MLIPLNRIMVGELGHIFPPSGMKLEVIAFWVHRFRYTALPCDPPIEVTREGENYRVTDGRHRFFAAVIAGRSEIEAEFG